MNEKLSEAVNNFIPFYLKNGNISENVLKYLRQGYSRASIGNDREYHVAKKPSTSRSWLNDVLTLRRKNYPCLCVLFISHTPQVYLQPNDAITIN